MEYNLGNVMSDINNLILNDEKEWSFSYAVRLIKDYRENVSGVKDRKIFFFGFSAGCQFLHRFLLFKPEINPDFVICSSAGWYTIPNRQI